MPSVTDIARVGVDVTVDDAGTATKLLADSAAVDSFAAAVNRLTLKARDSSSALDDFAVAGSKVRDPATGRYMSTKLIVEAAKANLQAAAMQHQSQESALRQLATPAIRVGTQSQTIGYRNLFFGRGGGGATPASSSDTGGTVAELSTLASVLATEPQSILQRIMKPFIIARASLPQQIAENIGEAIPVPLLGRPSLVTGTPTYFLSDELKDTFESLNILSSKPPLIKPVITPEIDTIRIAPNHLELVRGLLGNQTSYPTIVARATVSDAGFIPKIAADTLAVDGFKKAVADLATQGDESIAALNALGAAGATVIRDQTTGQYLSLQKVLAATQQSLAGTTEHANLLQRALISSNIYSPSIASRLLPGVMAAGGGNIIGTGGAMALAGAAGGAGGGGGGGKGLIGGLFGGPGEPGSGRGGMGYGGGLLSSFVYNRFAGTGTEGRALSRLTGGFIGVGSTAAKVLSIGLPMIVGTVTALFEFAAGLTAVGIAAAPAAVAIVTGISAIHSASDAINAAVLGTTQWQQGILQLGQAWAQMPVQLQPVATAFDTLVSGNNPVFAQAQTWLGKTATDLAQTLTGKTGGSAVEPLVLAGEGVVNRMVNAITNSLSSGKFAHFMQTLATDLPAAATNLAHLFGNIGEIFSGVGAAFGGTSQGLKTLDDLLKVVATFVKSDAFQGFLSGWVTAERWMLRVVQAGLNLINTVTHLGLNIRGLGKIIGVTVASFVTLAYIWGSLIKLKNIAIGTTVAKSAVGVGASNILFGGAAREGETVGEGAIAGGLAGRAARGGLVGKIAGLAGTAGAFLSGGAPGILGTDLSALVGETAGIGALAGTGSIAAPALASLGLGYGIGTLLNNWFGISKGITNFFVKKPSTAGSSLQSKYSAAMASGNTGKAQAILQQMQAQVIMGGISLHSQYGPHDYSFTPAAAGRLTSGAFAGMNIVFANKYIDDMRNKLALLRGEQMSTTYQTSMWNKELHGLPINLGAAGKGVQDLVKNEEVLSTTLAAQLTYFAKFSQATPDTLTAIMTNFKTQAATTISEAWGTVQLLMRGMPRGLLQNLVTVAPQDINVLANSTAAQMNAVMVQANKLSIVKSMAATTPTGKLDAVTGGNIGKAFLVMVKDMNSANPLMRKAADQLFATFDAIPMKLHKVTDAIRVGLEALAKATFVGFATFAPAAVQSPKAILNNLDAQLIAYSSEAQGLAKLHSEGVGKAFLQNLWTTAPQDIPVLAKMSASQLQPYLMAFDQGQSLLKRAIAATKPYFTPVVNQWIKEMEKFFGFLSPQFKNLKKLIDAIAPSPSTLKLFQELANKGSKFWPSAIDVLNQSPNYHYARAGGPTAGNAPVSTGTYIAPGATYIFNMTGSLSQQQIAQAILRYEQLHGGIGGG